MAIFTLEMTSLSRIKLHKCSWKMFPSGGEKLIMSCRLFGKHRKTGDLPLVPMRSTFLLLSMVRVVISDWIVSRFVVFICQGSRQI